MSRKLKDVEFISDQRAAEKVLGLSCDEITDGADEETTPVPENSSEIVLGNVRARSRQH